MILQPGKEQVYLPLLGETRGDPTSALRPALDQLGIEYLDLAPGFRARAAAGDRLFYEVDGHPNQAGYALIAQLVHAHIAENAARYGLAE
jgi:lysophospholipase L1-like esterase